MDYYGYTLQLFTCSACAWKGPGKKVVTGDLTGEDFAIHCPVCSSVLGRVALPTYGQVRASRNAADIAAVEEREAFSARMRGTQLRSADELPEISGEGPLFFHLRESSADGDTWIAVDCDWQIIAMELTGYGYYLRYLALGNLLLQKYGDRVADFIPERTSYLYGDALVAGNEIEAFRAALKGGRE